MSRLAAMCLLLAVCADVCAQAGKISEAVLPGVWQVKLDVKDTGIARQWFAHDFDDKDWKPVSTYKSMGWEGQGLPEHDGVGWYRVSMFVPMGMIGKHAYLYFAGVDEEAWVWINGQPAGERTCANTGLTPREIWTAPFALEVTDLVKYEQRNGFTVRVRNAAGMGGVYKPVFLFTAHEPLTLETMQARANDRLKKMHDRATPVVRYDVWTSSYAYEPVMPDTAPEGEPLSTNAQGTSWTRCFSKSITLHAACGELVPFAVHVRNRGNEDLRVRLDLVGTDVHHVDFVGAGVRHDELGLFMGAARVEPRYVDMILTQRRELVPDPLPRIGGANAIGIPPNQTRSFFYLIDTTGMPAGRWRGRAHVTPLRFGPVAKLDFQLNVAPVVLPRQMPIWVVMWDGNLNMRYAQLDSRGGDQPYLKLLRRTGCNVVMLHFYYSIPWPVLNDKGDLVGIDTVDFDRSLLRRRFGKDNFLLILLQPNHRNRYKWWGAEKGSEQWNRNIIKYFKLLAKTIREDHNIPDNRWAINLFDENIEEAYLMVARLVRQADPTIPLWADDIENLDIMKKAAPYVDIFAPNEGMIPREPQSMAFIREQKKRLWFYAHNGWTREDGKRSDTYHRNSTDSPHTRYRRHGWLAWNWNVTGMGHWIYGANFQRYSAMEAVVQYENPSFIYVGHAGPITSRRLEAYREGLEDYKLLWTITQAINADGPHPDAAASARAHIKSAVSDVLSRAAKSDPGILLKWRRTLLDDAAALCAAVPLEVSTDIEVSQQTAIVRLAASSPIRVWTWLAHGGRFPSPSRRGQQFIPSPEAGANVTVRITGLVPGEQCKAVFVIAGPQGQQQILQRVIKADQR